jgi:hypothetical protein
MVRAGRKTGTDKLRLNELTPVSAAADATAAQHAQLIEIRELLIDLLQKQGDERAGARLAPLAFSREKSVTMEQAAKLFWGKSVAKDAESLEVHVGFLKGWATKGLNGVVLETQLFHNKWVTSRQAVDRFKKGIFGRKTV